MAVNLAVRFVLELCALAALSLWGARTGSSTAASILLAVVAPLVAATAWGLFVSPQARFDVRAARWAVELAVFTAAVLGLVAVDEAVLAVALGAAYVLNRALLTATGVEEVVPSGRRDE